MVKNYSNTDDDPAVGKDCASALNDQGGDVIFQIASACGDGVFEAAKEKGFYAIGVDSDQKYICLLYTSSPAPRRPAVRGRYRRYRGYSAPSRPHMAGRAPRPP